MTALPSDPFTSLVGRDVVLRPIDPREHETLYDAETSAYICEHWWRGHKPPYDRWLAGLHEGVLVQFIIQDKRRPRPLGRLVAYHTDLLDRWAYLGVMRYDEGGILGRQSG